MHRTKRRTIQEAWRVERQILAGRRPESAWSADANLAKTYCYYGLVARRADRASGDGERGVRAEDRTDDGIDTAYRRRGSADLPATAHDRPVDISKALPASTANLPKVPASDAAAFARENAMVIPDGVATFQKPLYHVWPAGRYLEPATGQIGVGPNAASTTLRSLMLTDSANRTSGYVSIATDALLLTAAALSDTGKPVPSNAQLQDYAVDLQQISLTLNTMPSIRVRLHLR